SAVVEMVSGRIIALFMLVAAATASLRNDFTTTYGFTKIMTNCLGDEHYYGVLREIASAERWCQQQPIYLPEIEHPSKAGYAHSAVPVYDAHSAVPVHYASTAAPPHYALTASPHGHRRSADPVHHASTASPHGHGHSPAPVHYATTASPHGHYQAVPAHPLAYNYHQQPYPAVHKHQKPLLTAGEVYSLVEVTKAKVSNLTCTLKKLHKIDDYLNINILPTVERVQATPYISYSLKHDLVQGLTQCEALTKCLPLEYSDEVVPPPAIKRILVFLQCEKKHRLISCMKEDLKRHIYDIDVSPIKHLYPYDTDDETIERMLFVLYGAESN
ncbi:unnamed protein product, partial [Meganyctiphanes norvegica]